MRPRERICRLCLEKCDSSFRTLGNAKEILKILLLEIDLTVSEEPVMCAECAEILDKCFQFKSTCLSTKDYINSFFGKNNERLDLKDVCLSKKQNRNAIGISDDHTICVCCMGVLNNHAFIYLDNGKAEIKLEKCLPELDLTIAKKPAICVPCHEFLDNYFSFITNCTAVEEKIKKYCEAAGSNSKGLIELNNVQRFLSTDRREEGWNSIDGIEINSIKKEENLNEDEENGREVDQNYEDYMEMEDEKFDNVLECRSKIMLLVGEDYKKNDVIKVEENFYEEGNSGNVVEENFVEIGDEKFNRKLESTTKNMTNDDDGKKNHIIKIEENSCEEGKNGSELDHNYANIMERRYDIPQLTAKNILTCENRGNKTDVLKTKGNLSNKEEGDFERKDVLMEEDEKFTLCANEEITMKTDQHDFDSEHEMACTLLEIKEAAKITLNSWPEASRKLFVPAYQSFMDWRIANNVNSFSESVLLVYFTELFTIYRPSTIRSHYFIVKNMLSRNEGINIGNYAKLRALLKQKSEGVRPKKTDTFTPEDIDKFLTEASDDKHLATKVALTMGIMGACRATEMYAMKFEDVQDLGSAFLVNMPNSKSNIGRKFTITDKFYQICKKYVGLRPPDARSNMFFLNIQECKYTTRRFGINKLRAMGEEIATFLKLPNPEKYSGDSFRRSSVTLPVDAGRHIATLKRHRGGRSSVQLNPLGSYQ